MLTDEVVLRSATILVKGYKQLEIRLTLAFVQVNLLIERLLPLEDRQELSVISTPLRCLDSLLR